MGQMRVRQIFRWGFVALVALTAILQAHLAYIRYSGNFHTVIAGEVYRSAQVTPEDLAVFQRDYGIRSVLNLRGATPGHPWYDDEIASAKALGLVHEDFAMSASRVLTVEESTELIALMRSMPKPLLVHCRRGADRTGLAMALYLAGISGADESTAAGQLSIWFGHFSVPYLSSTYPMDESWQLMVPVLGLDNG